MSYDIRFLSRRDGPSQDEALEAMEDAAEHSEPIPRRLLEAWERIFPQARLLLGEVDITSTDRSRETSATPVSASICPPSVPG
ncbi:hypothetical protein ACWEGQ_11855 [Streptomyces seoulensis]